MTHRAMPAASGPPYRTGRFFDSESVGHAMEKVTTGPDDRLFRLFERFDTNKDGRIDEKEFGEILDRLGWNSPLEIRSLEFAAVDSDSDGLVDFRELADWWLDQN